MKYVFVCASFPYGHLYDKYVRHWFSFQLIKSKRYAKGAIFVYIVVFSLDYKIWKDSKQSFLYQIDRASAGGSVILKVK
jgi:hypothetical protein